MKSLDRYAAIGELFLRHGLISTRQLKKALDYQTKERIKGNWKRLGEILVHHGYCTEKEVENLLQEQQAYRDVMGQPSHAMNALDEQIQESRKATLVLEKMCAEVTKMG